MALRVQHAATLAALLCLLATALAVTTCPSGNGVSTTVTKGTTYWTIKATGCPNYDWTSQSTPNKAVYMNYEKNVPVSPVIMTMANALYVGREQAGAGTSGTGIGGMIGIASNGIALYGDADATGGDAYINEGSTFDTCGGHPSTNGGGEYHYHATQKKSSGCWFTDSSGSHSPLIGVYADGVPLYGPYNSNGVVPSDLDECRGHDSDKDFYHYHIPVGYTAPYLIECMRGCIMTNFGSNNLNSYVKTADQCAALKDTSVKQVYTSLDLTAFKSAAPAPATVATVLLLALGALAAVMMA